MSADPTVAGPVTYENARPLQELVGRLPLEKLLVETDCPFLSPHPFRGQRNEPARVRLVASKIAEIKAIPLEEVARVTTDNAGRFFRLGDQWSGQNAAELATRPRWWKVWATCQWCRRWHGWSQAGRWVLKILSLFDPIRSELAVVEEKLHQATDAEHVRLAEILRYLLDSGGKRIRPAVVILASKFHDHDQARVLPLAAAVEMLHTATLVHDDLLDGSALRRGNPTLNAKLGVGAVVLVGDYLFARAADLAAATESVPVVNLFSKTLMTICRGEIRHAFDEDGWRRTKDAYYRSTYSKTASLFAASAESGALLSGAPRAIVDSMREYGYNLGMAFQIVDDILDFVGDKEEMGKPIGSDLRQGTVTLPLILYLEGHPENALLRAVFEEQEGREEKIQALVDMVRDSPAIESARQEAMRFTMGAKEAIGDLSPNRYRQVMLDLADFLLERRR
jgi:geranylgeranyl pyrophosphate synthase